MTDVGSVSIELYPKPQDLHGTTAYIYGLWVNEPYRRNGIAKALLEEAEHIIRKEGHTKCALEWNLRDTPREVLEHLYINNGWNDVEFGPESALLTKDLSKTEKTEDQ